MFECGDEDFVARLEIKLPKGGNNGLAIRYPGHGDTAVDTHMNLATIPSDLEHLERLELVPFRAAIEASVDSSMETSILRPWPVVCESTRAAQIAMAAVIPPMVSQTG